jgi:hypothetical protein
MTGRARGVVLIPVALAIAATVAGARILSERGKEPPRGVTFLAYKLDVGQPLTFALAPGERDVAVTVQVEAVAGAERTPFSVDASLRDEAGRILWRSRGALSSPAAGRIAEGAHEVTAPRTLRLPETEGATTLSVAVEPVGAPAPRFGVIRVTRRKERATLAGVPGEERARALGRRASVFGWDHLDETARDVLLGAPLTRRSAADKKGDRAELVHVRLGERARPPRPAPPPGEEVDSLRGAAYTVRGPGAVRVHLAPVEGAATAATLRTVDHLGHSMVLPVPVLATGTDAVFVPPDGGALTVQVMGAYAPVRVRAYAEGGATRLGDATTPGVVSGWGPTGERSSPRREDARSASGRPSRAVDSSTALEIAPDRRRQVLWRAHPAGPPVTATLAGDGTARVQMRPVVEGGRVARVRWRIVDGEREISSGAHAVGAVPTPFDRLRPDGRPTTEAATFTVAGPPGSRLELSAVDAPVDLSLLAADEGARARVHPAYELPLEDARLRHAPHLRRRFTPFVPDNHAALSVSAGKVVLEGQVRLEPAGAHREPAGPFRALEPLAPRTRHVLVEQDDEPPPELARRGFAVGERVRLVAPADGRVVLDTHVEPEGLGGTLRVLVDDQPVEERRVNVTRSSVRLRLEPGEREVLVDGPPGFVLTAARGGGQGFAERVVWRLARGGSLSVPVRLGSDAATLNVVLYSDAPLGQVAELTARVEIDGGARGPGMRSADGHTEMSRIVKVPLEAARTRWLDRGHGAVARGRFAIRLADDLGPGAHRVKVTLLDGPERMHARFFVTGAARRPAVSSETVEWATD